MAHTVTVSSKGQITLPKKMRERHGLREGEVVMIVDAPSGVLVQRGEGSIRGMLKGKISTERFRAELHRLRREWTL